MILALRTVVGRSRRAARPALVGLGSLAVIAAAAGPAAAAPTAHPGGASAPASTAKFWGSFGTAGSVGSPLTTPFPVYLPGPVKQIGTSNSTIYALLTNGSVYAWGFGAGGQLGNGGTADSMDTAVKVAFPAGVKIASIPDDVMPYDEGIAIDTRGNAWGWGTNPFGDALCLGTRAPLLTPVKLPLRHVTAAAGAFGHGLYVAGGRTVACGSNLLGELGDGTRRPSSTPVTVKLPRGARVARLTASWANSGALLTNGSYYDWGFNAQGQLGQGYLGGSSTVPLRVKLPGRVREVSLGGSLPRNGQTLALLDNGSLYAWGDGRHYQLGAGTTASQPAPVRVPLRPGLRFTTIATSGATSYGITRGGDLYAWGDNQFGQVGDGSTANAPAPVFVLGAVRGISGTNFDLAVSLRAGRAHRH